MSAKVEREVKLGAWAGLTLPDLTEVVPGGSVLTLRPLRLRSTYYDAPDLRLARSGITLRYRAEMAGRRAEPDGVATPKSRSGGWTLKFPEESDGTALVRREIEWRGGEGRIPAGVLHLVTAGLRSGSLTPVARLRTDRLRIELRDPAGDRLVEIDDDEVSVLVAGPDGRGRRVAARFREIEVELAEGGPVEVLDQVVDRLRAAGAGEPDPTPKVVRALGPRALQPPDVAVPKLGQRVTAGEVTRAAIASSVDRLIAHDPGVRLGDDPEDVHQARVATRRLRSDLRTLRPLLDSAWVAGLREELGWIAGMLGAVRDTDVMLEHLHHDIAKLAPSDGPAGAALVRRLETQRRNARAALLVALDSQRYVSLLDALVAAAQAPTFAPTPSPTPPAQDQIEQPAPAPVLVGLPGGADVRPVGDVDGPWREPWDGAPRPLQPPAPSATTAVQPVASTTTALEPSPPPLSPDDPADEVLAVLVRRPWRHLRRAVGALGDLPADEALHEVRIMAKRCRYAAEAAEPAVGKPAARLADAVARLQSVLGDLNDSVVAEAWLRQAANRAPAAQVLVAGELIASQRVRAAECRLFWKAAWKKASAKRLRSWLAAP